MSGARRIVICGGGAIGAAIAYFLSVRGAEAIVIERHEIAGSASGKSGGFLALDWCRGSPLDDDDVDAAAREETGGARADRAAAADHDAHGGSN